MDDPEPVVIDVEGEVQVTGLLRLPASSRAVFVLAHGAGAGMRHPFMAAVADGLAALGIASLRYQFPYMESRRKRPDPPALCHATVRAAALAAGRLTPGIPLIAGGKSFGGRMTSQAQAAEPLPGVRGLAFLGFPLHPPRQPSDTRAAHLAHVSVPMLFLQGSRDEFAERTLLAPVIERLGARAELSLIEHADHSFHVPARSGRTDAEVLRAALSALATWVDSLLLTPSRPCDAKRARIPQ
jgi:uncharacterized protein